MNEWIIAGGGQRLEQQEGECESARSEGGQEIVQSAESARAEQQEGGGYASQTVS